MERRSALILTTKIGQSFKKRYFAALWDEAMKAATLSQVRLPGLDTPVNLHFDDACRSSVTLLSQAGCTPQQVAAITGHSLQTVHRILERYLARTHGLAEQAIFNFKNSSRTKFANRNRRELDCQREGGVLADTYMARPKRGGPRSGKPR
jgi:hypothetical protein